MCGLIGIAGALEYKDEAFFKRLLVFDYFRGTDSTGVAWLRKNTNEAGIHKIASHPVDLIDGKKFDKGINATNSCIFLGHNRAATMGKVNGLNAHPFQFGDIVGAHNGTLIKDDWTALDKETKSESDVDSAAIFNAINEMGVKNTIEMIHEGTTKQRGAWALTWFDSYEKKLYFLKNQHRPLYYAYNKELTKIIWASESWMIGAAAESDRTEYPLYEDEDGYSFFPVENNTLYCIDIEELKKTGKKTPPDWRTEEIKGKPQPAAASAGAAPFQGNPTQSKTTSNSCTGTILTADADKAPIVEISGTIDSPFGGYLDASDWEEIGRYGCTWCGEPVHFSQLGVKVWERTDKVLGPCCSGETARNIVYADPVRFKGYFEDGDKRSVA